MSAAQWLVQRLTRIYCGVVVVVIWRYFEKSFPQMFSGWGSLGFLDAAVMHHGSEYKPGFQG